MHSFVAALFAPFWGLQFLLVVELLLACSPDEGFVALAHFITIKTFTSDDFVGELGLAGFSRIQG